MRIDLRGNALYIAPGKSVTFFVRVPLTPDNIRPRVAVADCDNTNDVSIGDVLATLEPRFADTMTVAIPMAPVPRAPIMLFLSAGDIAI
ncbi:Uncharacterised protein [Klebsiella michiganensis]|nr:Uncharacterised protein [Klebsiella michiganensis]